MRQDHDAEDGGRLRKAGRFATGATFLVDGGEMCFGLWDGISVNA